MFGLISRLWRTFTGYLFRKACGASKGDTTIILPERLTTSAPHKNRGELRQVFRKGTALETVFALIQDEDFCVVLMPYEEVKFFHHNSLVTQIEVTDHLQFVYNFVLKVSLMEEKIISVDGHTFKLWPKNISFGRIKLCECQVWDNDGGKCEKCCGYKLPVDNVRVSFTGWKARAAKTTVERFYRSSPCIKYFRHHVYKKLRA